MIALTDFAERQVATSCIFEGSQITAGIKNQKLLLRERARRLLILLGSAVRRVSSVANEEQARKIDRFYRAGVLDAYSIPSGET